MWPEGVKGMNPKILTGCIYVAKLMHCNAYNIYRQFGFVELLKT